MPTWKELKPWIYRLLAVALLVYLGYLVREIWLPLAFAFLVALVLDPVVDRMERRGFSRAIGTAIIFGSFIIAVACLLFVSVPAIIDQGAAIQTRLNKVMPDQSPGGIDKALAKQGASPMLRSIIKAGVSNVQGSVSRSSTFFADKVVSWGSNLIWVAIIPIVAFYALRDFHLILGKMLLVVKKEKRELVQSAVSEVTAIFARYMRGLLLVSALNGLATWLLLQVLGVPSALVLGIAAGVLYSVPYLGALITVALVCGVSLLAGGINFMLLVLGANVALHQVIFDQIITPRIIGGHVGLHPLLAILALLIGNALLGLAGMILAVPVAACIQIGVLAMVPKLKQEIDLAPAHDDKTMGDMSEESKTQQMQVDATTELHQTVTDAIDNIEAKLPDEARRATVLARRKSRAHDADQQSEEEPDPP